MPAPSEGGLSAAAAAARPRRPDVDQFRPPRVAELVADQLRQRILSGDLQEGQLLPKEEDLRGQYPASKPSFREAMRILEAEGLITVRRGGVGGSVVHRPSATNVAYAMAMVLATKDVGIADVARALRECEPVCAALCAERPDRHRTVVPELLAVQEESRKGIGDLLFATTVSRRFHETLVRSCGNEPLIVMVGALAAIWSSHETGWAKWVADDGSVPLHERQGAFDVHAEMIRLIDQGDAEAVRELAASHLAVAQNYPKTDEVDAIDPMRVRGH